MLNNHRFETSEVQDIFAAAKRNPSGTESCWLQQHFTKYGNMFAILSGGCGRTSGFPPDGPICQQPRRLLPAKQEECSTTRSSVRLSNGDTAPCHPPPFSSGRRTKTWHFCLEVRKLNIVTWQDLYSLPNIDTLDTLAGAKLFAQEPKKCLLTDRSASGEGEECSLDRRCPLFSLTLQ
jgi:hypothetical protein